MYGMGEADKKELKKWYGCTERAREGGIEKKE